MLHLSGHRSGMGIAFDEGFLLALRLPTAKGERPRVARRELPAGLVKASAIRPNFESLSEVGRVASEMVEELDAAGKFLSLLVPDLALTTALYPASGRRSRGQVRDVKAQFFAALPFPAAETRFDVWRGAARELLVVGVRDAVAAQYEQIVDAVACPPNWLDGMSTAQIPEWARRFRTASGGNLALQLQLYRRHYVLTLFRGVELIELRVKLRAPGELTAVAEEAARLLTLELQKTAEGEENAMAEVSGEGALDCAEELRRAGSFGSIELGAENEQDHILNSLRALLERC